MQKIPHVFRLIPVREDPHVLTLLQDALTVPLVLKLSYRLETFTIDTRHILPKKWDRITSNNS